MPAEVDTSNLERYMVRLASTLGRKGPQIARRNAETVAGRIRSTVPRLTGRLAASVATEPAGDGWSVTYGSGVPYAAYIERRSRSVESSVSGAGEMFAADCQAMAKVEARP